MTGIGTAADADLLVVGLVLLAVLLFSAAVRFARWPLWLAGYAVAVLVLAGAFFFRDPERIGDRGRDLVLAPADGRVLAVDRLVEPDYLAGPAIRVSIFLSLLDVHVQRSPVTGVVEYVRRREGGFAAAWSERAESENQSTLIGIDAGHARVAVRQVTGLVARRIVTVVSEDEPVTQGQRLGLIRFGSRVDAFLPASAEVHVAPGDRVVAGTTVLARFAPVREEG